MAKILVVDDEPDIREVVSRFLTKEGHAVSTVSDGMFAMDEIRKFRPDLIILDIVMPGLDGCALGHHLKFDSEFSNVPIIVLTSLGDQPYLGNDIGADRFMKKPFDSRELLETVDELLNKKKPRAGARPAAVKLRGTRKEKCLAPLAAVASIAALLIALTVFLNFGGGNAVSAAPEMATGGLNVNELADRLFIYTAPAAFAVLLYVAFLLNKMTRKVSA